MGPIFYITLLLICMILIFDYCSCIRIRGDFEAEIHTVFVNQNRWDPGKDFMTHDEITDLTFAKTLCTKVAIELYNNVVIINCNVIMTFNMTVASSELEDDPITAAGHQCKCTNSMNHQLPAFCLKRNMESEITEAFVFQPRVLPQQQLPIHIFRNTILYADYFFVENQNAVLYHHSAPANVMIPDILQMFEIP